MSNNPTDSTALTDQQLSTMLATADIVYTPESTAQPVLLPAGYDLWERIRRTIDDMFQVAGYELFALEEVDDLAAIRALAALVDNGRDAPVLASTWSRAKDRPASSFPALDRAEWWQHAAFSAHKTAAAAEEQAYKLTDVFRAFTEEILGAPTFVGTMPPAELSDHDASGYVVEAMSADGRSLRVGETRVMSPEFAALSGSELFFQSAALAPRVVAAALLAHTRNGEPVFSPRVAPTQVAIIPVLPSAQSLDIAKLAHQVRSMVRGSYRTVLADKSGLSTEDGRAIWSQRGTPVFIEISQEDVEHRQVTLVRRDTGESEAISVNFLMDRLGLLRDEIHEALLSVATERREAEFAEPESLEELAEGLLQRAAPQFVAWDGSDESANKIAAVAGASIRVLPFGSEAESSGRDCIASGAPARYVAIVNQSY